MNNSQTHNRLAPAFFFLQDPVTIAGVSTPYPWLDLGTIETRASKVDTKEEFIMDDRSGMSQAITVVQNAFGLQYDLETPNTSFRILEMYYRSLPATTPSTNMAGGTYNVSHTLYSNSPIKLIDSFGNGVVSVTSIASVNVSGTTLVSGVDYAATPQDLAMGFIYTLPTSTHVNASGGTIASINFTVAAVAGNVALSPASGPCVVTGIGEIHFANCGVRALRERGRYSINIPELSLSPDKLARVKPVVTRLYDPTGQYVSDVVGYQGYPTP